MAYIGLDVGTSGVKATVVDPSGAFVLSAHREYDLSFPRPGRVEINAGRVWTAAREVLREAAEKSGLPIEAIATASFGEAAVLLNERGIPVCDSIFYTDERGSDQLDKLNRTVDRDGLMMRTGMPINYMFTLPKLMWLKEYAPEILKNTRSMLLFGSYIEYMLTGEKATDGSLASRTLMFNRETLDWDKEVLSAFGIDPDWLPAYVPAGAPVGKVLPKIAEELGLSPNTVVVSGVHDQIAAALGAGAIDDGEIADGIGSAECIAAVLPPRPDYPFLFENNLCAEPHAAPGKFLSLAFTNTAGAALKWYRDTFETELANACRREGKNAYAVLNQSLTDAPSPVLFLPHLAGTGTPYMDAAAKGMFAGLTLSTTRAQLYRAVYEGMNFEIRGNLELLRKAGMRVDELTAGGGGASPEALKIKADILNTPIRMLKNNQTGTVGMAMLCACALGRCKDLSQARALMVSRAALIEPRQEYRREYEDKYTLYSRMYAASRAIFA